MSFKVLKSQMSTFYHVLPLPESSRNLQDTWFPPHLLVVLHPGRWAPGARDEPQRLISDLLGPADQRDQGLGVAAHLEVEVFQVEVLLQRPKREEGVGLGCFVLGSSKREEQVGKCVLMCFVH